MMEPSSRGARKRDAGALPLPLRKRRDPYGGSVYGFFEAPTLADVGPRSTDSKHERFDGEAGPETPVPDDFYEGGARS